MKKRRNSRSSHVTSSHNRGPLHRREWRSGDSSHPLPPSFAPSFRSFIPSFFLLLLLLRRLPPPVSRFIFLYFRGWISGAASTTKSALPPSVRLVPQTTCRARIQHGRSMVVRICQLRATSVPPHFISGRNQKQLIMMLMTHTLCGWRAHGNQASLPKAHTLQSASHDTNLGGR